MKYMFFNSIENRLRSGWRVLIFLILFLAVSGFVSSVLKTFSSNQVLSSLIIASTTPIITIGVLKFVSRYIDHRKFKEYGFDISKRWWFDFIFGISLGALLISMIFFLEKALGWINVVEYFRNQRDGYIEMPFIVPFIIGLFFYISIGLYEEIFFRACQITNFAEGFITQNISARKALIFAYILSSILFSIVHSANPNVTFLGIFNIILMGFFFGLPYILSGELAISIALHISWNLFQGLIFGFPVSGLQNNLSIIASEHSGPQLWTGGAFGPEGGLIGSFIAVIGCGILLLWFKILKRPILLNTKIAEYDFQSHMNKENILIEK